MAWQGTRRLCQTTASMAVFILQHLNLNAPQQQHRKIGAFERLGFTKTERVPQRMFPKELSNFMDQSYHITNEDLHVKTNSEPMRKTVQERRLKWLRHVLKMPFERFPKVALHRTP